MKPVWESCEPRDEVLKGDLDDAIFAADFGDLIAGKARKVYSDPNIFFQNMLRSSSAKSSKLFSNDWLQKEKVEL